MESQANGLEWSVLFRRFPLTKREIDKIKSGDPLTLPPEKEVQHRDYQTYREARYWQERIIRKKNPSFTAIVRNKRR